MKKFIFLILCLLLLSSQCFGFMLMRGQVVAGSDPDTVQFGRELSVDCDTQTTDPDFTNRGQTNANISDGFTGTDATIHFITVYIGPASGGTTTYAGLYDDNSGDPGVQLTYGSLVASAGGWHKVPVLDYTTSSATTYHIVFGRGSGNRTDGGCDAFGNQMRISTDFTQNNLPSDDVTYVNGDTGALGMFTCGN